MAKANTHDEEHNLMMRVIFGDPDIKNDVGMKAKVDEMHEILKSVKGAGSGLSTLGTVLRWLLIIGAVFALFKGWWAGLLAVITSSITK